MSQIETPSTFQDTLLLWEKMPINPKWLCDFKENSFFYVHHRSNNQEPLFEREHEYRLFHHICRQKLHGIANIFSWSLLPHESHLLLHTKPEDKIRKMLKKRRQDQITLTEQKFLDHQCNYSELLEGTLRRISITWSMSVNQEKDRKGNLFHRPLRRLHIMRPLELRQAILGIHCVPSIFYKRSMHAAYPWSSYKNLARILKSPDLNSPIHWCFDHLHDYEQAHLEAIRFWIQERLPEQVNLPPSLSAQSGPETPSMPGPNKPWGSGK